VGLVSGCFVSTPLRGRLARAGNQTHTFPRGAPLVTPRDGAFRPLTHPRRHKPTACDGRAVECRIARRIVAVAAATIGDGKPTACLSGSAWGRPEPGRLPRPPPTVNDKLAALVVLRTIVDRGALGARYLRGAGRPCAGAALGPRCCPAIRVGVGDAGCGADRWTSRAADTHPPY